MSTEETKTETKAVATRAAAVVEVSESGYLQAKDIEGRFRMAKALFDSKMVPKGYESPQQTFAAMEFAIELGLRPFSGLRNIAMVNNSPSIWGELPLALARQTKELESIEEFLIDKEYNRICFANKNLNAQAWAAVCQIKRKGQPMVEAFFSLDDAKTAGLLSRQKTTPWDTYPKIMLTRRARSTALKTAFADALAGIAIAEYDNNYLPEGPESRDVTFHGEQKNDAAEELNGLFSEQPQVQQ
jgi:hypothetical protein